MQKPAYSSYIPCLDGIRALAILLVFFQHAKITRHIPGDLGVTIFFFLSGYLITTLLRAESQESGTISLKNFYIRRVFRILPPMYIALGLAALLGVLGLADTVGLPSAYLSAVFYVQNYYHLFAHRLNLPAGMSALWSLAVEEHFYLVWPLLYLLLVKRNVPRSIWVKLLLVACAIGPVWRVFLIVKLHILGIGSDVLWTYIATDCRFDSIAWGCLLAMSNNPLFGDNAGILKRFNGWFALAGLIVLMCSAIDRNPVYREGLRYTVQGIALYPLFYFCLISPQAWAARWLEWTPLRWLGKISYSFYLFHEQILRTLEKILGGYTLKATFVAFGVAILYATAMWFAVEQPLARLRKRLTAPRVKRKPNPVDHDQPPSVTAPVSSSAGME